MNNDIKKQLYEIIRRTLNEEDGGGDYGGYGDYGGGYGDRYGGGSSHSGPIASHPLMKAFVEPFTDVIKTAKMGVEKLTASSRRLIERLLNNVRFIVIPWEFRDFSENIIKREKVELANIEKKYSDVLKRTSDALNKGHTPGFMFLANPVMYMTTLLTAETIGAAAWFAHVIVGEEYSQSGKHTSNDDNDNKRARDNFLKKHPILAATVGTATGAVIGHTVGKKKINKQTEKQLKQYTKLYHDEEFKKIVAQKMNKISSNVKEDIAKTIEKHYEHIKDILTKTSTPEGIKRTLNYDIEKDITKIPESERGEARQNIINAVHDALKIAYINSIKQHAKQYNNVKEIKNEYAKLIKRINTL